MPLQKQPEEENALVTDFKSDLHQDDLVVNAPNYKVAVDGFYGLLDLVPCKQEFDIIPSCAFLAATIIGLDPSKVKQE